MSTVIEIGNLAAERALRVSRKQALREARGNIEEVHKRANDTVSILSQETVLGLSADVLLKFVERFHEVKLMVALSSPEVIRAFEAQVASLGRELTPLEKTNILARVAPEAMKVTLK